MLEIVIACGVIAVLYGIFARRSILAASAGTERMQEIAGAIQEGAKAYLNRQYRAIGMVGFVVAIILSILLGAEASIGFVIGAVLSGAAGYVGMLISVRANVRTTEAARQGLAQGLSISFRSGAVTGMLVAGFALLSISIYYSVLIAQGSDQKQLIDGLIGLAFGASLISIFARLGGGIFTKGADVGADLVGKVEAGIPEDDPRNPAVIADNVGDNVGDCAGMAADLFETYVVTVGATMVLALIYGVSGIELNEFLLYPMAICGVCLVASIIATFFVKVGSNQNIMGALYKGFAGSAIISAILLWPVTSHVIGMDTAMTMGDVTFTGIGLFWCGVIGLILTGLIVWVTEYYTSTDFRPVRSDAKASETGHGTNVIQGRAISMEATAVPAVLICIAIGMTHQIAGLIGIAIAVTAMLALAGMVVALDAYGPVTDNAGGIAEMAELEESDRNTTDALDAVGNTTAAIGKGFAIGSAALTALALFAAFTTSSGINAADLSLTEPMVVIGLLIGGALPFVIASMTMTSVGKAAGDMVTEIRRQFREIDGLLEGREGVKPDSARCVEISTQAALREMVAPGLTAIAAPVIVGTVLGAAALGGLLAGALVTGVLMALFMANAGGAWDNAKKAIEQGHIEGATKGDASHDAAIIGDTIGDPFKDTSGPSLNILIKLMSIVAVVIAPGLTLTGML